MLYKEYKKGRTFPCLCFLEARDQGRSTLEFFLSLLFVSCSTKDRLSGSCVFFLTTFAPLLFGVNSLKQRTAAETSEEVLPTHRTFMLFNPAGILHIAVGAYFAGFQVVSDVSKSDIPEDSPEHLLMIRLVDSFSSKQILHNIRIDCFQISEFSRHPLDDRPCKHLISGLAVLFFRVVQFLGLNNVRFVSIVQCTEEFTGFIHCAFTGTGQEHLPVERRNVRCFQVDVSNIAEGIANSVHCRVVRFKELSLLFVGTGLFSTGVLGILEPISFYRRFPDI